MSLMTAADSDINSSSFAGSLANYSLALIMVQTILIRDCETFVSRFRETWLYSGDERETDKNEKRKAKLVIDRVRKFIYKTLLRSSATRRSAYFFIERA